MKLFAYDHCPFCVKVRMILGIKNIDHELIILAHDDVVTPTQMIGCKMLPILHTDQNEYIPESLDIINFVDKSFGPPVISKYITQEKYAFIIKHLNKATMKLAFPRWVYAPLKEFSTESARQYYIENKEKIIGPFKEILAKTNELIDEVHTQLNLIEEFIQCKEAVHGTLSLDDFHLFATLRSLSIVDGIIYPKMIEAYRQTLSEISKIPLHDSFKY